MEDQIRKLKDEELDESISLSEYAFQYKLNEEERNEKLKRLKSEQIWGYFVVGKLAAKMTIFPMHTCIQGEVFAMGGVASVATWPEYRRKGMVGKLLEHSLKVMKEDGQTISFLHPFSFSFYREYGWETYAEYKAYTLQPSQFPKVKQMAGKVIRADQDWRLLNRIYETYARSYNGMLLRDEDWWRKTVFLKKADQTAVYYNESGEPRGYILYKVENKGMNIHEFIFLNEDARQGLWKFISNHDSMIENVSLSAPVHDQLAFLLPNPKFKQEIIPYSMARIVDVAAFLEKYRFNESSKRQTLQIAVQDRQAPWNHGTFDIQVNEAGEAKVNVLSNEKDARSGGHEILPPLSCDIQTFTAMLMGYQRPKFLHDTGRLQGNAADVRRWEALIPHRSTYLTDYF